jgi:putative tricarboxylic transport membrane protein
VKRLRSRQAAELVVAATLLLLGFAVLVGVRQMRVGAAAQFQPRLFPSIVGWLLVLAGGGLGLAARRTPADLIVDWPSRREVRRVTIILASVASYVLFIDAVGMPLATFLVISFEVWYLGRYRWPVPLVTGIVAAAIVYVVFMQALGLAFPAGPLVR